MDLIYGFVMATLYFILFFIGYFISRLISKITEKGLEIFLVDAYKKLFMRKLNNKEE